jgi:hypothetical protein
LSLGNGHDSHPAPASAPAPDAVRQPAPHPQAPTPGNGSGRAAPYAPSAPQRPVEQGRYGFPHPASVSERPSLASPPQGPEGNRQAREAPGSFIDQELRARVDTDIAVFLQAFDAALAADTQDSRSALREATDRLLRAGARTRIELERLEARVPLLPRDPPHGPEPVWRSR